MKLPHRRQFLQLAAGAAALPALSRLARAQAYPARPVHLIVGFPAGGVGDIARLMGQWMSERLGQPFVIENRPGAAQHRRRGSRAFFVCTATLCFGSLRRTRSTRHSTISSISISSVTSLPVASFVRGPGRDGSEPDGPGQIHSSNSSLMPRPILARSTLRRPAWGSLSHVAGELFKVMAGVDMLHVPYRGAAPALNDLIGGRVQVMIFPIISSVEHIKAGSSAPLG